MTVGKFEVGLFIKKEEEGEDDFGVGATSSSPKSKKRMLLDVKSPLIIKSGEKQSQLSFVECEDHNETIPMLEPKKVEKDDDTIAVRKPKSKGRSRKTNCKKSEDSMKQTNLNSFGIRRTARQQIKALEEDGLKVFMTLEKGRGVLATKFFKAGDFVVEYAGDLIFEKEAKEREFEYKKNPDIGSYMFYFQHGGKKWCVDATSETPKLGRLLNHSRMNPNCLVKVFPLDGMPRLAILAKRDIRPGEEMLYDYGDRDKESLIMHPWLKF